MLYSPGELPMSSALPFLSDNTISILLHLLVIFLIAVLLNRTLRVLSKLMIRPAGGQSRAEQTHEQQTRTLADATYSVASKVVWTVAILTAMDAIGISPLPALALAGLAGLAVCFGAQNLVRDVISGCHIVLEDQYVIGDTVEIGETVGRVEKLTLRRTVVRDARGAQVTIANGEIRCAANLSRDWSQSYVDVSVAPEVPLDKALATLESAAAELRKDAAWSQALVDGPRLLGVQSYDRNASVVRLQVRTLPMRHEEISRELRRRIQMEFQRQGIPLIGVVRLELSNAQAQAGATPSSPQQSN